MSFYNFFYTGKSSPTCQSTLRIKPIMGKSDLKGQTTGSSDMKITINISIKFRTYDQITATNTQMGVSYISFSAFFYILA